MNLDDVLGIAKKLVSSNEDGKVSELNIPYLIDESEDVSKSILNDSVDKSDSVTESTDIDTSVIQASVDEKFNKELESKVTEVIKDVPNTPAVPELLKKYEITDSAKSIEPSSTTSNSDSAAVNKIKDVIQGDSGLIYERLLNIEKLNKAQLDYLALQTNILSVTKKITSLSIESNAKKSTELSDKLNKLNSELNSANNAGTELIDNSNSGTDSEVSTVTKSSEEPKQDKESNLLSSLFTGLLSVLAVSQGFDSPLLGKLGVKGLTSLVTKPAESLSKLFNKGKTPSEPPVSNKPKGVFNKLKSKTTDWIKSQISDALKNVGNRVAKLVPPKAASQVTKVFSNLGKNLATSGAKAGAKMGTKAIPIVGNIIGAIFGIWDTVKRARDGDALGAVIAGVGALANFIPWGGNYISMALDGLNLALDIAMGKSPQNDSNTKSEVKKVKTKVPPIYKKESKKSVYVNPDYVTPDHLKVPEKPKEENKVAEVYKPEPILEPKVTKIEVPKLEEPDPSKLIASVSPIDKDKKKSKRKRPKDKDGLRKHALEDLKDQPDSARVRAAIYATKKSFNKPKGKCSRYVSDALYSANLGIGRGHAYAYPSMLENAGYVKLDKDVPPEIGDISTTPPFNNHRYGHVAIFNGTNWVSDFLQNGKNIYSDKPKSVEITSWRSPEAIAEKYKEQNKPEPPKSNELGGDADKSESVGTTKTIVHAPVSRTINNVTNNYIKSNNLLQLQLGNYDKH